MPTNSASPVSAMRYSEAASQGISEVYYVVLPWLGEGMKILDVGCNTGYVGSELQKMFNITLDGVEIDSEAAEQAARTYRTVKVADLDRSDIREMLDDRYDRILALDVIEHLGDPLRALQIFSDLLAPGGKLAVSVPNIANWRIRWQLLRGRFDYTDIGILDRTHLKFYTRKTIQEELARAGLKTVSEEFTVFGFPFRKIIPRSLKKRLVHLWPTMLAYQFVVLVEAEDENGRG